MLLVMYAAMELLLFAAISIKFGRMFTFSGFEAQRREVNAGDDPFGMGDVPADGFTNFIKNTIYNDAGVMVTGSSVSPDMKTLTMPL